MQSNSTRALKVIAGRGLTLTGAAGTSQRRVRSLRSSGRGAGSREGSSWQPGAARDGGRRLAVRWWQEMLPVRWWLFWMF